jgi:predicted nuclease of predicted toxin-antitoxin system
MKFIVDECTGPTVAKWLAIEGHDVISISPDRKGISDKEILKIAVSEERILITNDKDFGELIFKNNHSHCGVILLRLTDETATNKVFILKNLIYNHQKIIVKGHFVVVTEKSIRSIG